MKWVKYDKTTQIPIKSWCENIEVGALEQATNLSNHPSMKFHIALMPDCHVGYGMPIGGVIACQDSLIPNAVGVDIGCGMGAIKTSMNESIKHEKVLLRELLNKLKNKIPLGEGKSHKNPQDWKGFDLFLENFNTSEKDLSYSNPELPKWLDEKSWTLAHKNLGTLGGGNHFIEIQEDTSNHLWLMLHSGSRNLGYRVASHYHNLALNLNHQFHSSLPSKELAFLPSDSKEGQAYIRDMTFAMTYAMENRKRMMDILKETIQEQLGSIQFMEEINIHHNYASLENHFDKNVWVHRKGATSAKKGEKGIIPGSMGTSSYIVEGLGNKDSFMSCSHGAGRKLGRSQACKTLNIEDCDKAMEGIVFDRWSKVKNKYRKKSKEPKQWDLSEAPLAYKDINEVIQSELDLIKPLVKLYPIAVIKG